MSPTAQMMQSDGVRAALRAGRLGNRRDSIPSTCPLVPSRSTRAWAQRQGRGRSRLGRGGQPDVEGARLDRGRTVGADVFQALATQGEGDGLRFSSGQLHLFEVTQATARLGQIGDTVADIELDRLLDRAVAGVGDRDRHLDFAVPGQGRGAGRDRAIGHRAIGQAVAERIEGGIGRLAIAGDIFLRRQGVVSRATGDLVVVAEGLLARAVREADRQAAGRRGSAEDDVGDGVAHLSAQEPGDDDGLRRP